MTASVIDVAARVMARAYGKAIPIRRTSFLSPDPVPAFGIAPIRMVSEEQVQAIAFGPIGSAPSVAVRWNPLSRDPGELGAFAAALDHYIVNSLASGVLPRIWLPHTAALEALDMLGHRMDGNQNAAPDLQRMGALCRALVVEHEFPSQQVVAVAGTLLTTHVATGQAPIEDGHIRSVTAWICPPQDMDPGKEAARRSLIPANAMLQRHIDDEVERLRKIGKGRGAHEVEAQHHIEILLRQEAHREWDILIEARQAFWSLGLMQAEGVVHLVEESLGRFSWAVAEPRSVPSQPVALRRRLQDIEASAARVQDLDARSDAQSRERMRRDGRVIAATVERVVQPERRRRPEYLIIRSNQGTQRVRKGTMMKTGDEEIGGRVMRILFDATNGDHVLELALEKGRQTSAHYAIGNREDWFTTDVYQPWNQGINKIIKEAQSPLVFGEPAPAAPSKGRSSSLVEAAERLRRS